MLKQAGKEAFVYESVIDHVRGMIAHGALMPGDKAPSLRKLSKQLKVSITTVNQAYRHLESAGVLEARPQSGFYVTALAENAPETPARSRPGGKPREIRFAQLFKEVFSLANDPDVVPLGAAKPSMELMPAKALSRTYRSLAGRLEQRGIDYCFPPGYGRLRSELARRYAQAGMEVSAEQIIITSGATEAIALSLQAVAKRGDIIAVESPVYFSVLRLLERMGLRILEIDTDPETGICLDVLENALDTMDIKALLTVPNYNNPTGSLMPDERKQRLVEMLCGRGIPVIEDDIYGDLHFGDERPSLVRHFDTTGNVITCSSFSKTLAPGYRIGWIVASNHYEDLVEWKQAMSSATATIPQYVVADFLRSGDYDRHLVRLRKAYREQVEKMRFMIGKAFPDGTRVTNPEGGFVLWVQLPDRGDSLKLFNMAIQEKISFTPGLLFSSTRKYRDFIRINCGFPWNHDIEQAILRLGELVHRLPDES
jgi:DNA-binding transcriptional MocR family regulator